VHTSGSDGYPSGPPDSRSGSRDRDQGQDDSFDDLDDLFTAGRMKRRVFGSLIKSFYDLADG
jgi:hypothetical protein